MLLFTGENCPDDAGRCAVNPGELRCAQPANPDQRVAAENQRVQSPSVEGDLVINKEFLDLFTIAHAERDDAIS